MPWTGTITPVSPAKPGDLIHFWDVVSTDPDDVAPWIATGFQASNGVGGSIGGPLPQLADFQSSVEAQYTGFYRVEFNTFSVSALVPGFTYTDLDGFSRTVAAQTITVPAGGAWRFVKGTAVGSGGTARVRIAYFPGGLTNN